MAQDIGEAGSCMHPCTEIRTGIKHAIEVDRSSLPGLSVYKFEAFDCDGGREISNDLTDRLTPHKKVHGGITAHYPRRTDILIPRSVTRIDPAHSLASLTTLDAFERATGDVEFLNVRGTLPHSTGIVPSIYSVQNLKSTTAHTSSASTRPSSDPATNSHNAPLTPPVVFTTSITVLISTLSSPQSQTTYVTTYPPLLPQFKTTNGAVVYPTLLSTQERTTSRSLTATSESHTAASGSHPVTSRSQTPSLGIIAGSAVGGTAVLAAVVFTSLCFMRRRARRRNRYDGNKRVHSDSNSRSSSQANLEINHENEALDVTPVDHDGEIIFTAAAPSSTTATIPSVPAPIILPTNLPTSSPGVPIPIAPENSFLDLGSNSNPNLHQEPYQYLQRDPHPDCFSEHEVYTPCPSYSCISLRENNCTIGPASPQWYGRDGRGRWSEGEGGRGTTRGRGRSRSRSRPIARRTNIPSRSTAGAGAVSRAGTWMTASERSTETAPPSYDYANQ